jgi:putative SOS response-associated peptidase YedK
MSNEARQAVAALLGHSTPRPSSPGCIEEKRYQQERKQRSITQQGQRARNFATIMTTSNRPCAYLHNRMPVVLAPEPSPMWLGRNLPTPASSRPCLRLPVGTYDLLSGEPSRR